MRATIAMFILFSGLAEAAPLTLNDYLEQVKSQSPEGRARVQSVEAAKLKLEQADYQLSSQLYAEYHLLDSRDEPTSSMQPSRMHGNQWRVGVRDQTQFGLSTDVFMDQTHTELRGFTPFIPMMLDYHDTRVGIELRQSLWRNAFGSFTRADVEMKRAASRLELLKEQFDLKNLLLRAENTYWSLVSFNQIVKLQQENLDRVTRLRDWMRKREGMRLVDDVDALQAQASLETRELELMSSLDERAALMRQFNTLRGVSEDEVGELAELPTKDMLLRVTKDPNKRLTREDFRMLYEQAKMAQAEARGAASQIAPQLDLVAGVAANGLDPRRNISQEEAMGLENPSWNVGVIFSIPLDFSLLLDLRKGFKTRARAADAMLEAAKFNEERAWHEIVKQKTEAQRRYEKSVSLENLQTRLVKRERQRLLNGRSTTFQMITFEQNLALAQIQRVRSQLGLMQIHNVIKSYEVAQ